VITGGIDGIALTKLDVLDGFRGDQAVRRIPARQNRTLDYLRPTRMISSHHPI